MGIDPTGFNKLSSRAAKTRDYDEDYLEEVIGLIKTYPIKRSLKNFANFTDLADEINDFFGRKIITARYICDICNKNNLSKNKSIEKIEAIKTYITEFIKQKEKQNYKITTSFNSSNYTTEWYVLTPFFPAIAYKQYNQDADLTIVEKGDHYVRLKVDDLVELYWFDYGVAVWCVRTNFSLQRIFEFSLERRELYKNVLDGNHSVTQKTKEIINTIHKKYNSLKDKTSLNVYALSIVNLLDSPWSDIIRTNALKLFSNPSMLYNDYRDKISEYGLSEEVKNILTKTELDYLDNGFSNQEFYPFSIQGTIEGFATWAGVSFHIKNKEKCLPYKDFIYFEIVLQGFWLLLTHYKNLTITNKKSFVKQHWTKHNIKKHISKIFSILPREPIVMRLFKESVINTSRIDKLYYEFKEIFEI